MRTKKNKSFDLQSYLTNSIERIVADYIKATFRDPKETAYLLRFAAASRNAAGKRRISEENGEHIPPFLIASITSQCNLHCAGCYSRCNHATVDAAPVQQLSGEEWRKIFAEADELGISFILLAGGEPLRRRDVIEAAGERQNILFPIFTNGTLVDEAYLALFDRCRNLLPIMSIEGGQAQTDARRGAGIYEKLLTTMKNFQDRGLIFGASVTVTMQNFAEVTSQRFLDGLSFRGCKAVIFVEYVPMTEDTRVLALTDSARESLCESIRRLRAEHPEMVYLAFPGDEKSTGGCVAAGRGFFHINSQGGAEPCPFSPYSDSSVRDSSLREAMRSPLFQALQSCGVLYDDHIGGCVLFEKRALVEKLIAKAQTNGNG